MFRAERRCMPQTTSRARSLRVLVNDIGLKVAIKKPPRRPEKAGVGGSIPSLGTFLSPILSQIVSINPMKATAPLAFKTYYNGYRAHTSLEGPTPIKTPESEGVNFKSYRWHKHCRGLYQTPTAA
jgi:hypothetical protein